MVRAVFGAVAALSFVVSACGSSEAERFDEDVEKGGETYSEYDARRDSLDGEAGSVDGYGCTEDCSGHEAGRAWAEEHDINDPDDCGGTSWSFEEGCRSAAGDPEDEYDPVDDYGHL
ncbi:hypothetical protein [Sphingomonas arenae]|uniref:hypothetical protein n=1 Tax=Sphingomonas arenae TaxID=2812555 RepID=UPI001967F1FE|nr:hypothetical protein [Sphingomonas arenae]